MLSSVVLCAQNKLIDSLLKAASKTKHDSLRLNIYLQICDSCDIRDNVTYGKISAGLADKLIAAAKNFSERDKFIRKKIYAYEIIEVFYREFKNLDSVELYKIRKIELAKQSKNQELIHDQINSLAEFYRVNNFYSKAMQLFRDKLKEAELLKNTNDMIFSLRGISNTYSSALDNKKALEYALKTLRLVEQTAKDSNEIFWEYSNLASIYFNNYIHDSAFFYCKKSYYGLKPTIDARQKLKFIFRIARTLKELNMLAQSREYFQEGLKITQEIKSPLIQGVIISEIGQTYFNEKEYKTALQYKLEAIRLLGNNATGDAFLPFLTTAEVYLKLKNYKLAEKFALKANKVGENMEDNNLSFHNRKFVVKTLSDIYFAMGNKVLGNEYLVKFYQFKDSMDRVSNAEELLYSELRYENEKNEWKLLSEQKLKDQKAEDEKSKQRIIIFCVSVGLLLVVVFASFIFNRLKITKRQKLIIEQKEIETNHQKHLIEEKNKEITDSITYAKRLQEAILPPPDFILKQVSDSFIYYQPKDIVAGDFYWAEKADNKFFIAAADSTGHGVPGAMVSVVCSNALNRALKEFSLKETGKILDKTRELVLETFAKSSTDVKDGMDISLLCIDNDRKSIFWSGANNPLWYIQNNTLHEIKADKQAVGKTDYPKPFTTHEIEWRSNTKFYLFTDGFADQFGGPNGKKFKYKQFQELLIAVQHEPLDSQLLILRQKFNDWKGSLEQVDDVCILGIKV